MQSHEIRKRFLAFFEKRGHAVIPSASLVPANDPSVLFNTAGMQPLVPYLLGQPHPAGKRIVDIQKCVRTGDLEDVGDNRHLSFFEMMGNWSLGDYFKEDAIKWSFEFLTSKEEGLGLDLNRLYFTCFEGDENAPRDEETAKLWMSLGVPENRIYFLGAEDNWWSPGDNGPCGPDSEMFYDMIGTMGDLSKEEFIAANQREDIIEIWNDVFMEYEKKDGKVIGKLASKNVDTGAGLERISAVMQGKKTAYDTDLFETIFGKINEFTSDQLALSDEEKVKATRIVADHVRTATFMIADGVIPSNTDRGYVLRRLLRRAVRYSDVLGFKHGSLSWIAGAVIAKFSEFYPNLSTERETIKKEIDGEESKFRQTLEKGMKEFEKGTDPFVLFTTFGFPIELTEELAKEKGQAVDRAAFDEKMKEHQKLSQSASAGMFKGGLANTNEATVKLHTTHHLLLAALQEVLGKTVKQRGSNITEERLRIDFSFDRKMTDEEKAKVEAIVNDAIKADYKVVRREMPLAEAEKLGAEMEFGAKYGDVVSVYFVEDANGNHISKEFCGGPHVEHTGVLGHFKIQKEEASSQGVRRIKGILN
ncbi:MAG TPA: alanine--tRNA ligase [Candidatus Paceibacterota bacterium]|nr:alanine--tRNA ligase [Candidatus Paceibacterota bacterium]